MSYSDLYFKTENVEQAMQAIPVLLQALGEKRVVNMLGPAPGRAAVLDGEGNIVSPAAGEEGWYYAAVRTKRNPAEILGSVDLGAFGVAIATAEEVQAVVGVWA